MYNFLHPTFAEVKDQQILPGKLVQLEQFYVTLATTDRQIPTLYPYLSKAVVESVFSIPTYQGYNSDYSRLWMRKAFEKIVNPNIAYRKSKRMSAATLFKAFRKNHKKICNVCMEGKYAQHGLVNKSILHSDINEMRSGVMEKGWYIINLFCAELFFK